MSLLIAMDIRDVITGIAPLPPSSADRLLGVMHRTELPKGSLIFEEGRISNDVFFLTEGIVRAYMAADGREVTFWIGTEGAAIMSLRGYVAGSAGYETVECMEDSVLYTVKHSMLSQLFAEDISIANWGRRLAENELLNTEEKFIPLLFTTATERYREMLERRPDLLRRLPLECLASYLGVTPTSLSRIRASLRRHRQ